MRPPLAPALAVALLGAALSPAIPLAQPAPRGIVLGDLTWQQAERILTPEAVIVIPLGAESKEHGPQLRLDNDARLAAYFRDRVLAVSNVVIAPAVNYHFYPAFVEYPGSTHLRFETARDLMVDIVRSLAAYGPRRFYVLNTGVSTVRPLTAAAELLKNDGITLTFTNVLQVGAAAEATVRQQARGTHADEIETSMMLYMYPERVDMSRAVKDDAPQGTGGLSRVPGTAKTYSPSGVWGDATLATREKGRIVVEAMVAGMLQEIESLRAHDSLTRWRRRPAWKRSAIRTGMVDMCDSVMRPATGIELGNPTGTRYGESWFRRRFARFIDRAGAITQRVAHDKRPTRQERVGRASRGIRTVYGFLALVYAALISESAAISYICRWKLSCVCPAALRIESAAVGFAARALAVSAALRASSTGVGAS